MFKFQQEEKLTQWEIHSIGRRTRRSRIRQLEPDQVNIHTVARLQTPVVTDDKHLLDSYEDGAHR